MTCDNLDVDQSRGKIEYLWNVYSSIVDWIKFSDTKAGAVIAANIAIITIILGNHNHIVALFDRSAIFAWLLGAGVITIYLSIIFSISCLTPTLRIKHESSTIFFGHITNKAGSAEAYRNAINKVFEDNTQLDQICEQIWSNATVAERKYRKVRWAIRFFAATLHLTFLIVCLAVIIR